MKKSEKGLSAWQLTMMALGSVIGGSFFLGSSVAIHAAGPSILISFIIGGFLVYFILFALSEMTVSNPNKGSFRVFAAQAFGQGAGFVVGWVYWTGLVLGMSSEATAISILVREWFPFPLWLSGGVIIVGVTLLNLLGATVLSKLESSLAAIKLLAILSFIGIAIFIIVGIIISISTGAATKLMNEPLMPGGIMGIAGSMLIVMFAYAGFEIIGLASSETKEPKITVPKAIRRTVFILLGLYILSIAVILLLIPTAAIGEKTSPFVAVLNRHGFAWAGTVLNVILITAILSTMLAVMFGLGRMIRSLADEGLAPSFLIDKKDVPHRGILFSGFGMLAGLGIGLLFPRVYLFLISSGGFAILFTYAAIMATHMKLHKKGILINNNKKQIAGYPITSAIVFLFLTASIISMPFVSGQTSGLIAGSITVVFYILSYYVMKFYKNSIKNKIKLNKQFATKFSTEISSEFKDKD